jgi:hypothetical protein
VDEEEAQGEYQQAEELQLAMQRPTK